MCEVSVIIPVYNAEDCISICLESVVNQTLKNIEIIIVNDGSTDKSLDICQLYMEKDNRIRIFNKKNEGVSIARNIGIEESNGRYIMFVDSDDYIELDMIECMHKKIINNNTDLCLCNYIIEGIEKQTKVECRIQDDIFIKEEIRKKIIFPMIERDIDENKEILTEFRAPWGKLYNKKIIEKNKIRFNENLIIGEDFIFNLQFIKYANRITFNNQFFYHYKLNINSVTQKYKEDAWNLIYKKTIIDLKKYLQENNLYLEGKNRVHNLIIRYFIICIYNEISNNNTKSKIEQIEYIKKLCHDDFIEEAIKNININNFSIKKRFILYLAKYDITVFIYIITKSYYFYYNLHNKR